jgi:hypothetical protein
MICNANVIQTGDNLRQYNIALTIIDNNGLGKKNIQYVIIELPLDRCLTLLFVMNHSFCSNSFQLSLGLC